MARGYLGRAEFTAERFMPAPYGPWQGERIYRMGDLARRRRNGSIEYIGRKDNQVKIRGYRIERGEIESALLQHSAVKEAAVIARGDSEGEKRLIAYLVSGGDATESELGAYLRQRLPDYMVPAAFVMLAN